jgi:hypothetical protein
MKLRWQTYALLVVWALIMVCPIPTGLNAEQWRYFAIFVAVISGLVFESASVGAVGLVGLVCAGLSGTITTDPVKSIRWVLAGFSEGTVWLIVGAYVLAVGYKKSGLGKRIALLLVKALGRKTLGLGYAVAFADLLLGPATPFRRLEGRLAPIFQFVVCGTRNFSAAAAHRSPIVGKRGIDLGLQRSARNGAARSGRAGDGAWQGSGSVARSGRAGISSRRGSRTGVGGCAFAVPAVALPRYVERAARTPAPMNLVFP